jgi:hypothetical protein
MSLHQRGYRQRSGGLLVLRMADGGEASAAAVPSAKSGFFEKVNHFEFNHNLYQFYVRNLFSHLSRAPYPSIRNFEPYIPTDRNAFNKQLQRILKLIPLQNINSTDQIQNPTSLRTQKAPPSRLHVLLHSLQLHHLTWY